MEKGILALSGRILRARPFYMGASAVARLGQRLLPVAVSTTRFLGFKKLTERLERIHPLGGRSFRSMWKKLEEKEL
jgi:hypothetical protein